MEERIGPLDPATLAPPAVPDQDNRAVLVERAAAAVDLTHEDGRLLHAVAMRTWQRSPGSVERLRGIVAKNREALGLVSEAAARPGSNWGIKYENAISAEIPDLKSLVALARLVRAEAQLHVEEGRPREAAEAAARIFSVSGSLAGEPILIVQLIRIGIDHAGHGAVMSLLERYPPGADGDDGDDGADGARPLDAAALARLQDRIARARGPDPFVTGLTGEIKAIHHAVAGTVHSDSGPAPFGRAGRFLLKPLLHVNHRAYLDAMGSVLEAQSAPASDREGPEWVDAAVGEMPTWAAAARIAIPNMGDAALRRDLMEARHALASIALALSRHRLAEGRYPQSLDALAPRFLESIPADPFTGGPPAYALQGDGFTLKSAGSERLDGPGARGAPGARRPVPDEFLTWTIPPRPARDR